MQQLANHIWEQDYEEIRREAYRQGYDEGTYQIYKKLHEIEKRYQCHSKHHPTLVPTSQSFDDFTESLYSALLEYYTRTASLETETRPMKTRIVSLEAENEELTFAITRLQSRLDEKNQ